jgi:hypothetical protein
MGLPQAGGDVSPTPALPSPPHKSLLPKISVSFV